MFNISGCGSERTHLLITSVAVVVVLDRQGAGRDHQHSTNQGGHHLQQAGRKMANKMGDGEHEEGDGEEDAAADTDEISICVSKRKVITTLSDLN